MHHSKVENDQVSTIIDWIAKEGCKVDSALFIFQNFRDLVIVVPFLGSVWVTVLTKFNVL